MPEPPARMTPFTPGSYWPITRPLQTIRDDRTARNRASRRFDFRPPYAVRAPNRDRLAARDAECAPQADRGSLAFVDISGFTALTERLSKKGKVGAEEMNDLLNECFTELLSVAYDQGAGVIKWGGDAVLLLFDGGEHEARACRAALDMQRTMRSVGKLRTSSGLVTLRMSVGIHSDAFDFFLVGDLHRELVITGPARAQRSRWRPSPSRRGGHQPVHGGGDRARLPGREEGSGDPAPPRPKASWNACRPSATSPISTWRSCYPSTSGST